MRQLAERIHAGYDRTSDAWHPGLTHQDRVDTFREAMDDVVEAHNRFIHKAHDVLAAPE